MNEINNGGGAAESQDLDLQAAEGWKHLQVALAGQLARMTDDADHLIVELPSGKDDETAPYAQFAGFGNGMVRAELSGNAFLAPIHRLDDERTASLGLAGWHGNDETEPNWYVERPLADANLLALMSVWALRDVFNVTHPQLLTYNAWGPHADGGTNLGISASTEIPTEIATTPREVGDLTVMETPNDRDDLVRMVVDVLHAKFGQRPSVDEDGDIALTHLDQPVWVRVRQEQPAIEIFARAVHDVRSRRATAIEVALLNRDNVWVKWVQMERTVWQRLMLPGLPFVPAHLTGMVDVFFDTMTQTRDDLALRVMGKAA